MTVTWPNGAWPAARDVAADVVLVGDSITAGQSASHTERSYARLLREALHDVYGDGGSGFTPHERTAVGGSVSTGTVTETPTTVVPNGHAAVMTGAGPRFTMTPSGTEVAAFVRRNPADGTGRWRVDGGAWQAFSCVGVAGYIRLAVTGLAPGEHTIDVESLTGVVCVAGHEGRNATGVRLHLMGLGGRTSGGNSFSGITTEAHAAFRAATIGRWAPHLLIVNLGVNDSNHGGITTPVFKTNIEATIVAAKTARADVDVVLVANHLGKFADNDYAGKVTALRELVDIYGGLVVDLDTWARTVPGSTTLTPRASPIDGSSWGRWSSWSWYPGGDTVHPSDVGMAALAYVLGRVITT